MVLTAYIALSPVSRACLPPSPAGSSPRELDISVGMSGPHDFAVRLARHSSKAPKRPPHPAPNVHDDRETPLEQGRDRDSILLILPRRQEQFLKIRNWGISPAVVVVPEKARHGSRLCGAASPNEASPRRENAAPRPGHGQFGALVPRTLRSAPRWRRDALLSRGPRFTLRCHGSWLAFASARLAGTTESRHSTAAYTRLRTSVRV